MYVFLLSLRKNGDRTYHDCLWNYVNLKNVDELTFPELTSLSLCDVCRHHDLRGLRPPPQLPQEPLKPRLRHERQSESP